MMSGGSALASACPFHTEKLLPPKKIGPPLKEVEESLLSGRTNPPPHNLIDTEDHHHHHHLTFIIT